MIVVVGEPIEIRCGAGTKRDPHTWVLAFAGRTTPTRLFYRWKPDGNNLGPLRLDCEGRTWRKVEVVVEKVAIPVPNVEQWDY